MDEQHLRLEIYKSTVEIWRFEVDSYWQRNKYFAAFETAAIAGCWYLNEHQRFGFETLFSVLGLILTGLWIWSNVGVHRYIRYWWKSFRDAEVSLGLESHGLHFATRYKGSGVKPSWAIQLIPWVFALAWSGLVFYAICHLCKCGI